MDFLGLSFVLNPHDEAFERATSENIPVGTDDIQQSLAIADRVKGKEIPAKLAIQSLKKRLLHRNPNVQILTLKLIDVLVKNCGIHFHIELCSKDFYDCLCAIGSDSSTPETVRNLALELIQNCGIGFKSKSELFYAVEMYNQMKRQSIIFPRVTLDAEGFSNLLDTTVAPEWSDSGICTRCRTQFTTFNRKHHCRNCGKTFCNDCSSKKISLVKLGMSEEVRVCDNCHFKLTTNQPEPPQNAQKSHTDSVDEDMQRAIAESLRTTGSSSTDDKKGQRVRFADNNNNDEDDEQLRKALAESLKSSSQVKTTRTNVVGVQRNVSNNYPEVSNNDENNHQQPYQSPSLSSTPSVSSAISSIELSNILLFSELVEKTTNNPNRSILSTNPYQLSQLSTLFSKVQLIAPKLIKALSDSSVKYKQLYEMNAELTAVVGHYDELVRSRQFYKYPKHQVPQNVYNGGGQQQQNIGSTYTPQFSQQPAAHALQSVNDHSQSIPQYNSPRENSQQYNVPGDNTQYNSANDTKQQYNPTLNNTRQYIPGDTTQPPYHFTDPAQPNMYYPPAPSSGYQAQQQPYVASTDMTQNDGGNNQYQLPASSAPPQQYQNYQGHGYVNENQGQLLQSQQVNNIKTEKPPATVVQEAPLIDL